jgi:predicted site-specific integrase-resolvase
LIVAIYVRVSTDQQAEKGYSLETQLAECRKKIKDLPKVLAVEEFIEDGYSGAYLERPALEKLRNALREKRFGAVIVYDPDRLARNLTHQLIITDEIESSGAHLHFVKFEWVVNDHLGIRAITTRLAQLQYPTRTDKNSWNIGTVHDIIRRETYAGTHWVNKEYKTKVGRNKFKRGSRKPSDWIAVPVPPKLLP